MHFGAIIHCVYQKGIWFWHNCFGIKVGFASELVFCQMILEFSECSVVFSRNVPNQWRKSVNAVQAANKKKPTDPFSVAGCFPAGSDITTCSYRTHRQVQRRDCKSWWKICQFHPQVGVSWKTIWASMWDTSVLKTPFEAVLALSSHAQYSWYISCLTAPGQVVQLSVISVTATHDTWCKLMGFTWLVCFNPGEKADYSSSFPIEGPNGPRVFWPVENGLHTGLSTVCPQTRNEHTTHNHTDKTDTSEEPLSSEKHSSHCPPLSNSSWGWHMRTSQGSTLSLSESF